MQNPTETTSAAGLTAKDYLFIALGFFTLYLLWYIWVGLQRQRERGIKPTWKHVAMGAVTAFFDTLGIGSFATTTSIARQWRLIDDAVLPGTLNVGHALGTVAQAYIYTKLVPVDSVTLISMIAASVVGA